ncbi:unnamed protein product [Arctogadus glacialis]
MEEVEGMRVGGVGLGRSKTTTVPPQGSKSAQCMTVVVPVEEAPLETGSAGTKSPDIQSAIPLIHSLKLSWPGLPYTLPLEIQRFVFGEAETQAQSCPLLLTAGTGDDQSCTADGQTYTNRDIWKPEPCRICVCDNGQVLCDEIQCDDLGECQRFSIPDGECCPICETGGSSGTNTGGGSTGQGSVGDRNQRTPWTNGSPRSLRIQRRPGPQRKACA